MKKLIAMMLLLLPIATALSGCKSDEDKVRETAEAYLYKNMKNPESLKILSCEIRKDTVPFYLVDSLFDLTDKLDDAMDEVNRYAKLSSYLWYDEQMQSREDFTRTKEAFETLYTSCKSEPIEVEYIAYIKSSGTNPMGGTVSSSSIIIVDKDDPKKILGAYNVDSDFLKRFAMIKIWGEDFDFKKNRFGKYDTEGLPYFEQFVMNEAE